MVGNVSGNIKVTQTFTRNVEEADRKYAQKHENRNLGSAPNQNIETGTRGAFKSSLSFFKESLKGFFASPMGKKIEFLKDRIELRSIQKSEASQQQRLDRLDAQTTGRTFVPPNVNNLRAPEVLTIATKKELASLSVTLGSWLSEIDSAKVGDVGSKYTEIAKQLMTNLAPSDWKTLDLPALKRAEAQFRTEGRIEKANFLGAINTALAETVTQTKAEARFGGVANTYIENFRGEMIEFWRNNNEGGELELKIVVSHGFANPFKDSVLKEFGKIFDEPQFKDLPDQKLTSRHLTKEQAETVGKVAERLLDVMSKVEVTEEMTDTLATVKDQIESVRTDDKSAMTRKFFLNAVMLKTINVEAGRVGSIGTVAAQMLYEAIMNTRTDTTYPFGEEVLALHGRIGEKGENMLKRLGMPDNATFNGVRQEKQDVEERRQLLLNDIGVGDIDLDEATEGLKMLS
jgi:hypothetical protein